MSEQGEPFNVSAAVDQAKRGRRTPSLKYIVSRHGGATRDDDIEQLCREWSDATLDAMGKLLEEFLAAKGGGR